MNQPDRWKCEECSHICENSDLLTAPSPFDSTDTLTACPKCKSVNALVGVCDEPGCNAEATCGFPTDDGYRRTCFRHYQENNP